MIILVISSESAAITCTSSCTANDVRISNPRITDVNGNEFGCQYSCTPGSVVDGYLTLDIVNGAAADRYNVYLFYDKFVGGVNQGEFSSCLTPQLDGKSPVPTVTVPITFICGKSLVLSNVMVTWSVKKTEADCVNRGCPDVSSKCWRPGTDLAVQTPLVVDFNASTTCYCGNTLFTDLTTGGGGGYRYDWDFGDGTPHSTDKNPAHHYSSAGDYQVTLSVTDSGGCTARRTKNAKVLENPTANFSVNQDTLCYRPGIPTAFDASATRGGASPYSFVWNFGDGSTGAGQITSHQYKDPGTYNVALVATDAKGCQGTVSKEIKIKDCDPPIISEVTTFASEICEGLAVTVTAKVEDYVGASSVSLNYQVGGVLKTVTMGFDTGSVKEGYWRAEIPGQLAGTTVTYWIKVSDGTYISESANQTVTWQSCNPPEILEVDASTLAPCEGADVAVTANIRSDFGIYSVILSYDGVNISMSGPTGSTSGWWTASISGSGRIPGNTLTFRITATDVRGGVATSQSYTITWRDCTPPVIETVVLSSASLCAGDDVVVTAAVTDDVEVSSVVVSYEGSDHPMTGPLGSSSGDWTFTLPGSGRSPGDVLDFTVRANDSSDNVAETTGQIAWRDCDAPKILKVTPSSTRPCAGSDVLVTAHVTDDKGVDIVTLNYDGTSVNMTGPTGSMDGNWTATIPGTGKVSGDKATYHIDAADGSGNSASSGTFTVTWTDCTSPVVAGLNVSTASPCSGDDVTVTATLTDDVGVASATLTYGGVGYAMTGPAGSKSGDWTATIPGADKGPGDFLEFTVTAKDGAGNVASSETSRIEWIDCDPPSIVSVSLSTDTPCAGDDVVVTVRVTDDVEVSSVVVSYEGSDHLMTGPSGSKSGDWTLTVPGSGRSPGDVLDFTVRANDSSDNVAETNGQIGWRDCNAPEIQTVAISPATPCAGSDVLVTAHLTDDHGVSLVTLVYDGTSVNMTGPTGSTDGNWTATIPGSGKIPGDKVAYEIDALDSDGNLAKTRILTITWIDCTSPTVAILTVSTASPCSGDDVMVTATLTDDVGVASATLNYGGLSYAMTGPAGSTSGNWTATIPGGDKKPGDFLEFTVTAKDGAGNVVTSEISRIDWIDCDPPVIDSTTFSTDTPCAGDDVVVTAAVTDDVEVSSVVVSYEGSDHPMTGPSGSSSGDWTFTLPGSGRSPGDVLDFTVRANDSSDNVAETTGQIAWRDCDAPKILKVTPSSTRPCAGSDVLVTAHVTDDDGVDIVTLNYDGTSVNMTGPTGSMDGNWTATIPGSGKVSGDKATYHIDVADGSGNSATSGTFTVTWTDCTSPSVADLTVSTSAPCSGDDVMVTATLTDDVGVASATLNYGGLSYAMTGPAGSKSGNWTATISGGDKKPGDFLEFTVTAKDGAGNVVSSETSRIDWIDCDPPSIVSVSLSTETPCAGDDVVVTVHVTDEVEVSSVVVSYEGSDHPMTGPSGSSSGDWTFTVPGSGRSMGDTLDFFVRAKDPSDNLAERTGQIVWRDCDAPEIQTVAISPTAPCAGSDVLVTAHVTDDHGVSLVTLIYDGTDVTMTGPTGSQEGDWTATIPGSGKSPGDKVSYEIDAEDSLDNSVKTGSFTITWIDCVGPVISEISPGSSEMCEIHGEDLEVSARIHSRTEIVSAVLSYTDPTFPGDTLRVDMQQDLEDPERWVAFLRADIERPLTYKIIVSDGIESTTSEEHVIDILECDVPAIMSHDILPPCEGQDAEISLNVEDVDMDAYRVTLYYDEEEHPMYLLGDDPYPVVGEWVGAIPASDGGHSDNLTYYVNVYTLDTLGPNPGPFGPYTIDWRSCSPSLSHTSDPTSCAGQDAAITAHATCPLGIKSSELYFTDSTGQYVGSMVLVGGDPTDGDWRGLIPSQTAGSVTTYYMIATNLDGLTTRSPPEGNGSYSVTWQECGAISPINLTKTSSPSQVSPGEQFTYTITYGNNLAVDLHNVTIKEFYPPDADPISATPPATNGNDTWNIGTLPAGGSGQIIITMQAPLDIPGRDNLVFDQEGEASGEGFVNIYRSLSTERPAYNLKNVVTLTTAEGFHATATAQTLVDETPGTALKQKGHGSGTSEREEHITLMTKNRSIQADQSLSATYSPTTIGLYNNRTATYSSKWAEESEGKNWVTAASMSEYYRYATRIDRESRIFLDKNESLMEIDAEFDGMGHVGFLKMPSNNSTHHTTPLFESQEDYSGSFRVLERTDEYGKAVSSEKSASGEGLVAVAKRVGESQKSYESGTGAYNSDELIRTHTNYIAKDITLVSGPTNLSLTGDVSISSSMKWKEGMSSRVEKKSYIGEEYTSITELDKETVSKGLNEMETIANFSGRARYRTVLEPNQSEPEVDFDEAYDGTYSVERRVLFSGIPKYDRLHLSVTKEGSIHEETILRTDEVALAGESRERTIKVATYTITVENDGNKALGNVYVIDLFPPGAKYIDASVRPTKQTEEYANWNLTHLGIGDVSTIILNLDVTENVSPELVNRVEVCGVSGDEQVCASNFSAIEMDWLNYRPGETISVAKTAEIDPENESVVLYEIEIKNLDEATRVATVTDSLPEGMILLDSTVPFASYEDSVVVWNLAEIEPYETVTIAYQVEAQYTGRFVNTVMVDARSVDGPIVQPVRATCAIDVGVVEEEGVPVSCETWQPPNWELEHFGYEPDELTCEDLTSSSCEGMSCLAP